MEDVGIDILPRAKGIQYRREEAVGGWFSQMGHMHLVYHLWGEPLDVVRTSMYICVLRMGLL